MFVAALVALRAQRFADDEQLSRSMVPHQSIAIKTCEPARLSDPAMIALGDQIVRTQREEIAQMRAMLDRLNR